MKDLSIDLLASLMQSEGEGVSFSSLLDRFSASRKDLHECLNSLLEAKLIGQNQCQEYFLMPRYEYVDSRPLRARLSLCGLGQYFHYYNSIDSTNLEARRLLDTNTKNCIVVASEMTQGRARRGREWIAKSAGNLYLSLGFIVDLNMLHVGRMGLWVMLKLAEHLRHLTGLGVGLKWPNDLMCQGRKISGTLIETSKRSDGLVNLVIGVGLNVNEQVKNIDSSIAHKASSLRSLSGQVWDINAIAAAMSDIITRQYCYNAKDEIESMFDSYNVLEDMELQVDLGTQVLKGRALGIDRDGLLKIAQKNGDISTLSSGEVSLCRNYS